MNKNSSVHSVSLLFHAQTARFEHTTAQAQLPRGPLPQAACRLWRGIWGALAL